MPKKSAIEILVFKPDPSTSVEKRGVHENLRLKQRFEQYLSIGVYQDGHALRYYLFSEASDTPVTYPDLATLKQALAPNFAAIFATTPKLFIMGHGRGDCYGLGNYPVEILDAEFDKLVTDFESALPTEHGEIVVTLEACNTDNQEQATRGGQENTFLARLSEKHQHMTFCGTGPWNPDDPQTGYRASGGFPTLHTPITSTGGGIWKHGNSVIFYSGEQQLAARKPPFSSTQSAKQLKTNTVHYAKVVLASMQMNENEKSALLARICKDRNTVRIEDLTKFSNFADKAPPCTAANWLLMRQNQLLQRDQTRYLKKIKKILERARAGEKPNERDLLIIALGLKHLSVFNNQPAVLNEIMANTALLSSLLVTCGKALIADLSNDNLIDFLLRNGADINAVDTQDMTALHYAVQCFYNYRYEPLNLIRTLLKHGASPTIKDHDGRTALELAKRHSQKSTVMHGEALLTVLKQSLAAQISHPLAARSLLNKSPSLFQRMSDEYLIDHRHEDDRLQAEYDSRFGLVLKR